MQSINDDKSSSSYLQYINKTFVNPFKWYIRVRFVKGSKYTPSCFLRNDSLVVGHFFFYLFDEVRNYIVIIGNPI